MTPQQKYSIDFQGLSIGEHHFEFEVGGDLFAMWSESEIADARLEVDVELVKHSNFMELEIDIAGEVKTLCDRCLDEVWLPIEFEGDVLVKISTQEADDDDDIIWLRPTDDKIELAQYIYESTLLSLPIQRVHSDIADCNPEMINRITFEN